MNIDLSGRRALVTGSTQGIGYAIAAGLAAAGAEVLVNGRSKERVDEAVARRGVRPEGVGLAPAAGEGEDELGAQWLPERMTGGEVLEVGHHVVVVPQGDLDLHPGFRALQTEFLPPGGRTPGEGALDPGERRSSPQGERLSEQL